MINNTLIYVDKLVVAEAGFDNHTGLLTSEVTPKRPQEIRSAFPLECPHASPVFGFAYTTYLERFWPILYCPECLAITAGREPLCDPEPDEPESPRSIWAREWPRQGKPRSSGTRDPVVWPDGKRWPAE